MVQLSVSGQADLRALAHRLRTAGDEGRGLTRDLRREMRAAGKPALTDVKRAALAFPARTGQSTGLRAATARATTLETRFGAAPRIRFRVAGRRMPAGKARLPRYMDRKQGWRHPVYGNRDVWVQQDGHPWFASTLIRHGPRMRLAIVRAMETTAHKITGG